jgi:hypothetical protein
MHGQLNVKKTRKYCFVINGEYNNDKIEVEISTPNLYSEISVQRDVGGPPGQDLRQDGLTEYHTSTETSL